MKLYFKTVVEVSFKECVKMTFLTSVERYNADVNKGSFSNFLWRSLDKFHTNIEAIFYVPLYLSIYHTA